MVKSTKVSYLHAVLGVALALGSVGPLQGQTAPTPTQVQLAQMIEAKAYRPALRAIAQVLPSVVADKTPGYDKHRLLMMRGECLLQLKDGTTAIAAYEQAIAAAGSLAQNEAARAMAVLLRKSPSLVYTPRTGESKTPLDLLLPDARQRAMVALLNDDLPTTAKKVGEAVTAKSIPPILALAPALRDLHALEQMGTGDDKQTLALIQPLGDRIHELMDAELNRVNEHVTAIKRAADRVVDYGGGSFQMVNGRTIWVAAQGNSGLTGEHRQALREAISYLGKIGQTSEDLTVIARRYERSGERWQTLAKRARGLVDLASAIYEHE